MAELRIVLQDAGSSGRPAEPGAAADQQRERLAPSRQTEGTPQPAQQRTDDRGELSQAQERDNRRQQLSEYQKADERPAVTKRRRPRAGDASDAKANAPAPAPSREGTPQRSKDRMPDKEASAVQKTIAKDAAQRAKESAQRTKENNEAIAGLTGVLRQLPGSFLTAIANVIDRVKSIADSATKFQSAGDAISQRTDGLRNFVRRRTDGNRDNNRDDVQRRPVYRRDPQRRSPRGDDRRDGGERQRKRAESARDRLRDEARDRAFAKGRDRFAKSSGKTPVRAQPSASGGAATRSASGAAQAASAGSASASGGAAGVAAGGAAAGSAGGSAAGGAAAAAGGAAAGSAAAGGASAAAGGSAAGGAAAGGAGGAAAALGPLAIAAAAGVVVIGAAILAIKGLTKRMTKVSDQLQPFSGAINAARARAEAKQIRDDIRAANKLGERLGRFTSAQSGISRAFTRIARAIEGPLLNVLVPLLEAGEVIADGLAIVAEAIGNVVEFGQYLVKPIEGLLTVGRKMLGYEASKEKQELIKEANVISDFLDLPDLSITFNGRVYGPDRSAVVDGRREFDGPLPLRPLQ